MLYPFISKLQLIEPLVSFQVYRDKDDDKFLNCAVEATADYIISGDDDLLALNDIFYIPIISARAFLNIIDQKHTL